MSQPAPSIETSNRIFTIPNVISFIRLLASRSSSICCSARSTTWQR